MIDFDDILPQIGSFGRYQKLLIIFICLPTTLPCAFFGFLYIFQLSLPEFNCAEYSNPYNSYNQSVFEMDKCHIRNLTNKCIRWNFDNKTFSNTAASQFNMVCDKFWLTQFAIALFYFGSLCGHLIFGHIIDLWGRRVGFFLCLSIELFFGILIVFSPNIYVFMLCQFFVGVTIASIFDIPFVTSIELVGPDKRACVTMLMCFTYSSGVVVFSIIAYFVRDWKTLTLIVSVPFITFYIYWWFLPESIRWLLVKKKYQRAEKIIQKAARINHINIPPNFLSTKLDENELKMKDQNQLTNYQFNVSSMANDLNEKGEHLVKKQLTMKDLLTHKNMRLKTFIITFAWVANVLSYVGLQNYLTFFNDLHLNFLLASLAELPGYIFLWLTLDRIGRKFPFCTSMLISGFSVLAVNIFYQYSKMLVLVLALIGKLGISTSFVIIYLYASEIYPTELRGTGMALTLMVSRIFTIAVPFINYLGTTWILIPTIIMGLVTTLAGFLALLLPETLNKKLPETLEESEKIGLDFGIFKTCKKTILNAIFSI